MISCSGERREVGAAVALVVAMLLLVTGCAQTVTGTAAPAPGETGPVVPALPLDPEDRAVAAVFAKVRSWDMCAVHDVAAAARVTGYGPDELLPYLSPDSCRMVLKQPDGVSEWELTLDIAPVMPLEGAPTIDVGSVQAPQTGSNRDETCSYTYPIGPDGDSAWGIELTSYNVSPNRPPCDVARDYLTALGERLASPPLRSAGRTSPALTAAGSDPCALAAELVPVLADGAPVSLEQSRVSLSGPYGCSISAPNPAGTLDDLRSEVEFSLDSTPLEGASVAGHPATQRTLGNACLIGFRPSDVVIPGNPGLPPTYELVEVTASCDRVQQAAETAARALGPARPASAPAEGATALGDLDAPPTPQQAGAPFDPCAIVGWDSYPAELRPTQPKTPAPVPVGPDSGFSVGCSFNTGPMFSTLVWGIPGGAFSADPAARPGGLAAQFGGKPGVEQRSDTEHGPACYGAVQLANGIAAISTMLTSGGDPCAVNRPILEQVAARVP